MPKACFQAEGGFGPGPALHTPLLSQADGFQFAAVFVFDPLDSLELGVHNQRPALGVAQDSGILGGHAVAGEALIIPGGHVCIICQQAQGIQAICDRDGDLPREAHVRRGDATFLLTRKQLSKSCCVWCCG